MLRFVWLHSRHGESWREHLWNLYRGHEKLKRVQGGGITSRWIEAQGWRTHRQARGTGLGPCGGAYSCECVAVSHHSSYLGSRCQAWTASYDNLKGWWSVACCIPSLRHQALHLPSFRGIVSQWVSFVTIDLLHADTRAVFLRPSPISTVGKQLNPSPNQCSLFNLSYWLACPSTDWGAEKIQTN